MTCHFIEGGNRTSNHNWACFVPCHKIIKRKQCFEKEYKHPEADYLRNSKLTLRFEKARWFLNFWPKQYFVCCDQKVLIILRQRTKHAQFCFEVQLFLRARSQIPVLGLTRRTCGGQAVAPGVGFSGQNLRINLSIFHAQVPIYE